MRLPFDASGLRAEDQHEVGAVDVGHGQQELVAEHQQRGEHLRELIDRRRGEAARVRSARRRTWP